MDLVTGFNIFQDIGPNYLGGKLSSEARVAIQMVHRWGAFILLIICGWLALRLPQSPQATVGGLLVIQFGLGICNVAFDLPLAVATAHNACAALLLIALLTVAMASNLESTSESNNQQHDV